MTYKQTIDFLFSSLPMFQRIGDAAVKKDLNNILYLSEMLGQPQESFPSIHIAGTNGKGSTSHMLASVFQASGKKVGLYTSPHYVDFRERIKINGVMLPEKEVIQFVHHYKDKWLAIQPSFFEITVAMAFYYFRKEKVDIAIIETGLGGRLDSTNIITPRMSVITNIGFDHMQMLGHTLPAIAYEKAGIIKPHIPVVIGEWQKETSPVFKHKADKERAPIHFASRHLFVERISSGLLKSKFNIRTKTTEWLDVLSTDLTGPYQQQNIRTVLETVFQWNRYYPDEKINDRHIRKGLSEVKKATAMIGRWMVIRQKPLVIADAAHNHHGMSAMLPGLLSHPARKRHFVLGFVADKDISKMLSLFPGDGHFYWCAPDIPRAKAPKETQQEGLKAGLSGVAFKSVKEAYAEALKNSSTHDLIFVGGSSYVVGDFLSALNESA
jgi:dihydrofolate synthase/folylpolyglutamate synthase